jgi:hypothetical protein
MPWGLRENDRFFPLCRFSFGTPTHVHGSFVPKQSQAWDRHKRDVALTKTNWRVSFASFCDVLVSQGLLSDAHLFLLEDMVADFIALRSSASASASGGSNGAGVAAAHEMHVAAEQMSQLLGYVRA